MFPQNYRLKFIHEQLSVEISFSRKMISPFFTIQLLLLVYKLDNNYS